VKFACLSLVIHKPQPVYKLVITVTESGVPFVLAGKDTVSSRFQLNEQVLAGTAIPNCKIGAIVSKEVELACKAANVPRARVYVQASNQLDKVLADLKNLNRAVSGIVRSASRLLNSSN